MKNFILNSSNADASTGVTWFGGTLTALMQFDGLPLGVSGTGELGVKVLVVGDTAATTVVINQATPGTTNGVVVNSSALPTGAATAAKQPALGIAGTASADVISIQGVAGMTPLTVTTPGALTDRSGAITTGGTAQQVAASNATRKYFFFQNNSDTDMWINFGVTAVATQPSIKIAAGGNYENPSHFCQNALVSVICATTGKTFTSKEA